MVGTALAIEREMEDAQGIRDASAGGKRKEDQPSSSLEKRQRTSVPRVPQVQGQSGPMTCFYCHQPGYMKRDCPLRYGSQGFGPRSPSYQWDRRKHNLFFHTLVWVKGISFSRRVLYKNLRQHRQVRGAGLLIEVRDRLTDQDFGDPGACLRRCATS